MKKHPSIDDSFLAERNALTQFATRYHKLGWLPATAGNLSIKDNNGSIYITASGLDKGNLRETDFVCLNDKTDARKPSAETSIHEVIYEIIPEARCVIHLHTIESNLLQFHTSEKKPIHFYHLPENEIIKAFGFGIIEKKVPVVFNYENVQVISDTVKSIFSQQKPSIPFFIIEKHGITVWGRNCAEANKHVEATDFLLKIAIHQND